MDDLLREFLTETSENIAQLDIELVRLEQNPNDPELIGSIFRLVHTVKGTCGFLGLTRLEHVAHAGENVLGKFRDRKLDVTPHAVTLILQSIDTIKSLLAYLEQHEAEQPGHDEELIAQLNAMADGKTAPDAPAPAPAAPIATAVVNGPEPDEFGFVPVPVGETGLTPTAAPPVAPPAAPPAEVAKAEPAQAPVKPVIKQDVKPGGDDHAAKDSVANQSIRVDLSTLEKLMTTVSELVLTRNQLLQILRDQKDAVFATPLQRLNQVTSELQESVMKTRMQPIGNAWSKLPRIVRDLSVELGKKIDLQMVGADTELDRQVLELIKDPLTHMVRNSGDHGIEKPIDRVAAGKPETGTILLNAYHQGGHIIIEISDDGKGLDLECIKSKVLQNNMATEAEVAGMSSQQIMQFIFKAGFSTAAQVTAVSGRGVGMDVVRTNIEKIGGTIDMQSTLGKGSRFLIKIPLTLAIVSALIVECSGERFAIPQIGVVELVHASANSEYRVEQINNTPVLRLRNRLLPLISLRKILKLGDDAINPDDRSYIVVAQVGSATFGIIVDRVFDTEEIVVKPVSPILRNIPIFSGNTILGDGSVVMILDLNGIVTQIGVAAADIDHAPHANTATRGERQEGKQSFLLFRAGAGASRAVPLSLVARLEQIERKTIEYAGGAPVVQYRGKLMPLIPIDKSTTLAGKGFQPILVFADRDRNMGLIVDEIIDIVEDFVKVDLATQRPGCFGTSIISGEATDIVDATYYLTQAFKDWFGSAGAPGFGQKEPHHILLVDDSPFFRNLLTPFLTVAGYKVTIADNPIEALKLQETGIDFDAIISDIEMPKMNGFDFAATVRREGRWSQLPILAMSAHATPEDLERGRQVGFTDYVAKYNRDDLLASLNRTLGHQPSLGNDVREGAQA
jgi:two-component system chemotaxis sensor kinase CheA